MEPLYKRATYAVGSPSIGSSSSAPVLSPCFVQEPPYMGKQQATHVLMLQIITTHDTSNKRQAGHTITHSVSLTILVSLPRRLCKVSLCSKPSCWIPLLPLRQNCECRNGRACFPLPHCHLCATAYHFACPVLPAYDWRCRNGAHFPLSHIC